MSQSYRLTDEEQTIIENAWIVSPNDGPAGDDDPMYVAVERILHARVADLPSQRDVGRLWAADRRASIPQPGSEFWRGYCSALDDVVRLSAPSPSSPAGTGEADGGAR